MAQRKTYRYSHKKQTRHSERSTTRNIRTSQNQEHWYPPYIPIVSNIQSPHYSSGQFLANNLTQTLGKAYYHIENRTTNSDKP